MRVLQLYKNAPALQTNQSGVYSTIPREIGYAKRTSQLSSFTTTRSLATPACVGAASMAMDGHAGQPRHVAAPLAGQPASTVLAPTLDEVTEAAELVGAVATASGRVRRWRGRTGHLKALVWFW